MSDHQASAPSSSRRTPARAFSLAKTWKNILWHDPATNMVKIATHARFDKGMNDLPSLPPNAAYLKWAQHGSMPPDVDEFSFLDLDVVDCPSGPKW